MMKTDYSDFFNSCRKIAINDDRDLIYQVGWSINNRAIGIEFIEKLVEVIQSKLVLDQDDYIIDFCCGNGLISYELSLKVKFLVGVDFSKIYIENANKFKLNSNTKYILGSVLDFELLLETDLLNRLYKEEVKILMSNSLGYFHPKSLYLLLSKLNKHFKKFRFYLTGIPDIEKYKKAFPTISGQINFIINDRIMKHTKGIGRFWSKREITNIANGLNLIYVFDNNLESIPGQEYRFNLLIIKE